MTTENISERIKIHRKSGTIYNNVFIIMCSTWRYKSLAHFGNSRNVEGNKIFIITVVSFFTIRWCCSLLCTNKPNITTNCSETKNAIILIINSWFIDIKSHFISSISLKTAYFYHEYFMTSIIFKMFQTVGSTGTLAKSFIIYVRNLKL